ncbi:Hsp20/alpha crystallin family protein [Nocardiopsis sp. CNT312]|uniref:Hsp20/alpha crystallin family protein n=1 Tax=Nocardiopsis sp. CNT312 TaxID=1137268 RepID=UPI00048FA8BC|nr:Hsp20/alpha crystallin family protein [Nocardiopsis sp. CNT312]
MSPKKFSNPFHGVADLITEMTRISDTMSSPEVGHAGEAERGYADAWSPPTDILAQGNDLIIRCDISGVREGDFSVSLSEHALTIIGERRRDDDDVVYYSSERFTGAFRREIGLPEGVRDSDIEANYDEGLLEVKVHGGAHTTPPSTIKVGRRRPRRT